MDQPGNNLIAKKVCWLQSSAFLFLIVLMWLEEVIDIPYILLGGPATPINWRESLFETVVIGIISVPIIRYTYKLLTKIGYLESLLPICASCKQIRMDQEFWKGIKKVVQERAATEFTHGICPDCIEKYYPELQRKSASANNGVE